GGGGRVRGGAFSRRRPAYEVFTGLEFRRVLFRSAVVLVMVSGVTNTSLRAFAKGAGQVCARAGDIETSTAIITLVRNNIGPDSQIGRASCRERGWGSTGGRP